jgi:hypothetical protein
LAQYPESNQVDAAINESREAWVYEKIIEMLSSIAAEDPKLFRVVEIKPVAL